MVLIFVLVLFTKIALDAVNNTMATILHML